MSIESSASSPASAASAALFAAENGDGAVRAWGGDGLDEPSVGELFMVLRPWCDSWLDMVAGMVADMGVDVVEEGDTMLAAPDRARMLDTGVTAKPLPALVWRCCRYLAPPARPRRSPLLVWSGVAGEATAGERYASRACRGGGGLEATCALEAGKATISRKRGDSSSSRDPLPERKRSDVCGEPADMVAAAAGEEAAPPEAPLINIAGPAHPTPNPRGVQVTTRHLQLRGPPEDNNPAPCFACDDAWEATRSPHRAMIDNWTTHDRSFFGCFSLRAQLRVYGFGALSILSALLRRRAGRFALLARTAVL